MDDTGFEIVQIGNSSPGEYWDTDQNLNGLLGYRLNVAPVRYHFITSNNTSTGRKLDATF